MNEELLWAWAAGLIDGEGHLGIAHTKRNESFSTMLAVQMGDQEAILKLRMIFKTGRVALTKRATWPDFTIRPGCLEAAC